VRVKARAAEITRGIALSRDVFMVGIG